MAAKTFVRARVDETLKQEAAAVLAGHGLDRVRRGAHRVDQSRARHKALPFEMRLPNSLIAETLAESERSEDVHQAKDASDLFDQLGI